MTDKRRMTAEDLYQFENLGDCQLSPSGQHVLYTVQRVDPDNEKKYTNLWLVATEDGEARQFTFGDHSDTQPRWSPDGNQIAFLSNREDEKQPQIYLIPFGGGEARCLTDLKGSFGSLEWSPDGARLLVSFRKKDQEAIEREADPRKKELGIVARHITRVYYKMDGLGYLPQERWHIWVVDVASGEATQLTDGSYDEQGPTWSPDGQRILFASNRSEDPDFMPEAVELYTMPAEGGEIALVETDHAFQKFMPQYSPDGRWIAYLGRRFAANWWQNNCLYLVPAGGGKARNLTLPYDYHVSNALMGDTPNDLAMMRPTWTPDSKTILFQVARHGRQPLMSLAIDRDDVEPEVVVDETGGVGAYSLDATGQTLAYLFVTMTDPGSIKTRPLSGDEPRTLTAHNGWLEGIDFGELEEVWIESPASQKFPSAELQGWILKPPGFDPERAYPTIVEIHGGPQMMYGHRFMHEFYFLAAAGYVVAFCNPRGSQGYGDAFAGVIYNDWGTVDYDDITAWTDYVETLPYVDPARMGVTGGSYGGYMTSMIIGRTHRFKAAVAQRVVSNWLSMWGTSDFNHNWTSAWGDENPWENVENYWRVSPMRYIGGAQTPTLIIHSENDYRCNLEQGEQVYVALKKLGVDSEMVLFPGESHGLSRGGRTDRRVARLSHILRWMNKYLQPE